jgi:hypothetical protein
VEAAEEESVYISMTDMMVGVVFIFILLLSFFGLEYHVTTGALLKSDDPRTTALLQSATALQPRTISAQVDVLHHVVCLPARALSPSNAAGTSPDDRRCFAFSATPPAAPKDGLEASIDDNRAAFMGFLNADLAGAARPVRTDPDGGVLEFSTDQLFLPDSDALSPEGAAVVAKVADALAARLPCFGYPPHAPICDSAQKMSAVNVIGDTRFNAFTPQGQHAWDLSLKRTVAFYRALVARRPALAAIRDAPASDPSAQPLIRIASEGQSRAADAPSTAEETIAVKFVMKP